MNNPAAVAQWAAQNIPREITIQQPAVNSAKVKVAGALLVIMFGGIALLVLWSFVDNLSKKGEANWGLLAFPLLMIAFLVWIMKFMAKKRSSVVVNISKNGVVTAAGKKYEWQHLQSVTMHKAMKKYSMANETFCYLIHFNFATGQALSSSQTPDFPVLLSVARQIPVHRKEKVNAMYR